MTYRKHVPGRIPILGIPVDALTRAEVLARCADALGGERLLHIVTANPEILLQARRDRTYTSILQHADLVVADGVGVLLAARLFGQRFPERIPGVELLVGLCRLAVGEGPTSPTGFAGQAPLRPPNVAQPPPRLRPAGKASRDEPGFAGQGRRVYFLGGWSGVAEKAARRLHERIPGLDARAFAPDHAAEESPTALWDELRAFRPTVLFVAYGAPKQEEWISKHREQLERFGVRVAMGVGGAFDTLSGKHPRAPRWIRAIGVEWLWRLVLEPHRFLRIVRATVLFPATVVRDRWYRYAGLLRQS
ncbi:MAG: WecB/TagA/CpsF family glycosyltransferase [bacterium]|nr:WecB/TagA/CpsF family glycosyltransferase [bacterium]